MTLARHLVAALLFWAPGLSFRAEALSPDPAVLAAQDERADAMARASRSTIAIFDGSGAGGGSGVIISADGFALTNFHVVAPCGPAMKCGLDDGKIYGAVVVGIDPVGDLAMIQLLGRDEFPVADIGDSDKVEVGDWVFAAGNPFLLADDFRPSISYGIVSGVHRYQYPAGTLLEYTDCIQTDAAINPGNSGGPLWNAEGRLIGINGRGSFEKRGRVNVGVGYAISINQAMRFKSHLASGRIVDHASLGATVSTEADGNVVVDDILESSDAFRRGLEYGDTIIGFADRDIRTANALKNVLGVYPAGWRVPMSYRREGQRFDVRVRLASLHDESALADMVQKEQEQPSQPKPGEPPSPDDPDKPKIQPLPIPRLEKLMAKPNYPAEIARRYVERRGYANYWYNQQAQKRLWDRYVGDGHMASLGYAWKIRGRVADGQQFELTTTESRCDILLPDGAMAALFTGDVSDQLSPPRSGGLLLAIHAWQRLVDKGFERFGEVYYVGRLPHGPDGRVEDCLVGLYEGMEVRFFFGDAGGDLTGIELFSADDKDPCEVTMSDFELIDGRLLPKRWRIDHGEKTFAELTVDEWKVGATSPSESPDAGAEN